MKVAMVRDLRANIAAEAGARQTYESLIKLAQMKETKNASASTDAEISIQMFMKLDSMGKLTDPMFGNNQMKPSIFTTTCLLTENDERGPWNSDRLSVTADPVAENK